MYFWNRRAIRPQTAGAPSPLLEHLAGEFAPAIAGLWPEPHAPFLAAPAARRHLLCLALAQAAPAGHVDGDAILHLSLRRAIRLAVPDAPEGLARALERLGERAWDDGDYRNLLSTLASRQGGKALRHAETIAVDQVRALAVLPPALLDTGVARLDLNQPAAELIVEAYRAIAERDGAAATAALTSRWGAAENRRALALLIQDDLEPEPAPPPFAGAERLRPLATKSALLDAAGRYKNCLRNYLGEAADGSSAFYEWLGEPGALLEICRDRLYGWTLNQARLSNNDEIPEPTRAAITAELTSLGVRVGWTLWSLDRALDDFAGDNIKALDTHADHLGRLFGA